MCSFLSKQAAR